MIQFNTNVALLNLVKLLKVNDIYDNQGKLNLIRHGRDYDGGYVVAKKSLLEADVLMGYGIADDNSFEDLFSLDYNKPSYGFDCGVEKINSRSPLYKHINECIGSDNYLYDKSNTSSKITSYSEQLKNLQLEDKKVFIKMDIEGAEYEAFRDILLQANKISGIVLEIHFGNLESIDKAIKLFIVPYTYRLTRIKNSFAMLNLLEAHLNPCFYRPNNLS